jgi:hypothetical protein
LGGRKRRGPRGDARVAVGPAPQGALATEGRAAGAGAPSGRALSSARRRNDGCDGAPCRSNFLSCEQGGWWFIEAVTEADAAAAYEPEGRHSEPTEASRYDGRRPAKG